MLKYRDRTGNLSLIRTENLGNSDLALFLKEIYKKPNGDQTQLIKVANEGNRKFLHPSPLKDKFLKYNSSKAKIENPLDFRETVLTLLHELVPKGMDYSNWLLHLKDPTVSRTAIRPAQGSEELGVYGAIAKITQEADQKHRLELIFSNNDSEPIPYLLPLIVHEFQHFLGYKEKLVLPDRARIEYEIIEEAKGFDVQMRAYVAMAKENPELFCNWLYPTWAYGDLLVPLSWTMHSMEIKMKSGSFIFDYARMGSYEGKDFLLNKSKTALRSDIQKKITDLKLKYVH